MEGKKWGALGILSGIVMPWLVFGSIKMFKNETDIAVSSAHIRFLIETVKEMDIKLDAIYIQFLKKK